MPLLLFTPRYQLVLCWLAVLHRRPRKDLGNRLNGKRRSRFLKRVRPFMEHEAGHYDKEARKKEEARLYTWFLLQRGKVKLRRLERLLQKRRNDGFLIRLKSKDERALEVRINNLKGWILVWENRLGIGNAIQQPREEVRESGDSNECSALCNVHPSTMRARLSRRGFFLAQRDYYGGDGLGMCGV